MIDEVSESLGLSPEQLVKIDSILDIVSNDLAKYEKLLTESYLTESTAIVLDKSSSELKQGDDHLTTYRDIVQEEIQKKEEDKQKMEKLLNIWEVTYDAERSTDLSNTVKTSFRQLIDTIKTTNKKLDDYLNRLLELDLKLNKFHTTYESLLKKVLDARSVASKNIFMPDSDPIWKIYSSKKDTVVVKKELKEVFKRQKQDAIEYYKTYRGYIHFAIFIIILA